MIQSNKVNKGRLARMNGYAAEDAACTWLETQGLRIVERNIRYAFGELDIVAWDQNVLILFEVRLRTSKQFGGAINSLSLAKQNRLWQAANAYMAQLPNIPIMRIDLLAYNGIHSIHKAPMWLKNILMF